MVLPYDEAIRNGLQPYFLKDSHVVNDSHSCEDSGDEYAQSDEDIDHMAINDL